MNRVKQRPQVTPELSTCCGNHSCKTKERHQESFPLPVPCYTKTKKSPEEHLHDLTYKCTSRVGTARNLPAMEKGSSKTEKQNIMPCNFDFTVPSLPDWSVTSEKDQPAFCHQADICHMERCSSSIHFRIGRLCFKHQIFHGLSLEGDRGHVERDGKQKSPFFQIQMFQIFITGETEKHKY